MRKLRRKVRSLAADAARTRQRAQQEAEAAAKEQQQRERQQRRNAARGVTPRKPEVFDPTDTSVSTVILRCSDLRHRLRASIGTLGKAVNSLGRQLTQVQTDVTRMGTVTEKQLDVLDHIAAILQRHTP